MKWIAQYTGFLRQLRLLHWLNNLRNYKALIRNRRIYKALGIKRSVFRSIDSRVLSRYFDLKEPPICLPEYTPKAPDAEVSALMQKWESDGFLILQGHFSTDQIKAADQALQNALEQGVVHYNYTGRKVFNAHEHIPELREMAGDADIRRILERVFQRPPVLFQTISFNKGSEQKPHSDSIHMTTVPLGYLAGVWIALEDLDDNNGPLTYFPGSHRLPYILNKDYGNSSNALFLDGRANSKYEQAAAELIETHGLKEKTLYAKAGDVLIWHANLLHGGAPIRDPERTRKSMVAHYFAKDVLCFHEISERPAILP